VALSLVAIWSLLFLPEVMILSFKKLRSYPDINVVPGQYLIQLPLSISIEGRIKFILLKRVKPPLIIKVFTPSIEFAAQLPGVINNLT